jgi:hypothetical protein
MHAKISKELETKHYDGISTSTPLVQQLTWIKGLSDLIFMGDVPRTHFSVLLWRIKRFNLVKFCLTIELNLRKCFLFSEFYRIHLFESEFFRMTYGCTVGTLTCCFSSKICYLVYLLYFMSSWNASFYFANFRFILPLLAVVLFRYGKVLHNTHTVNNHYVPLKHVTALQALSLKIFNNEISVRRII